MQKTEKFFNMRKELSFENLVASVSQIQEMTSGRAKNAVNQMLTVRNWAIGFYIVEYEQNGADRAKYGDNLLDDLAKKINIKGLNRPMLVLCRSFYLKYPQIRATVTHRFETDSEVLIADCPFPIYGSSFT